MKILHYTLGLAPQRSGGMTKYAFDLMCEQAKKHSVTLLYPSGFRWWSRRIYWQWGADMESGVSTIQLKNSLPVPLLYGITSPERFISSRVMSEGEMASLYLATRPDILHIHTLMGLPKELLVYLKGRGVKLILSSHDYFGLCMRVNFTDSHGGICDTPSAENCAACCAKSHSPLFLRVRNSGFVLNLKSRRFVRWFLKR